MTAFTNARATAHEFFHGIVTEGNDGHSLQRNDIFSTRYEILDIRLSEKERYIVKMCVNPLPNPNFSRLVKETKYDNK